MAQAMILTGGGCLGNKGHASSLRKLEAGRLTRDLIAKSNPLSVRYPKEFVHTGCSQLQEDL